MLNEVVTEEMRWLKLQLGIEAWFSVSRLIFKSSLSDEE